MIEHGHSMCRALGSISSTPNKTKENTTNHWTEANNRENVRKVKTLGWPNLAVGCQCWTLASDRCLLSWELQCRVPVEDSACRPLWDRALLSCATVPKAHLHILPRALSLSCPMSAFSIPAPADAFPLLRMTYPDGVRGDLESRRLWCLRVTQFQCNKGSPSSPTRICAYGYRDGSCLAALS